MNNVFIEAAKKSIKQLISKDFLIHELAYIVAKLSVPDLSEADEMKKLKEENFHNEGYAFSEVLGIIVNRVELI